MRVLFALLDHVYRYPSTYSSPNTHLIGRGRSIVDGGLAVFRIAALAGLAKVWVISPDQ